MNHFFNKRRVLGLVFLAIAITQVVAGLTLLTEEFGVFALLAYWSACLMATAAAVVCAMLDAVRSLGQSRRERRVLPEETLREIDEEQARRMQESGSKPDSS